VSFNAPNPFLVGNSNQVANLNAQYVGGLLASAFWQLGGNAGTAPGVNFLGTADNQPLELKVNGQRALRLEPTAGPPNVIGGSSANSISAGVVTATIGGGDQNAIQANAIRSTIAGGVYNQVSDGALGSAIGGGSGNVIGTNASYSTASGGTGNTIGTGAVRSTIAGGDGNAIGTGAVYSAIGGGW
jgi:hypothetical protein